MFEVEPNSTPYRLEQSHIFVTEQTNSIVFTFQSYETHEFIGSVEVNIDELIKYGLQNGTIWQSVQSPRKDRKENQAVDGDGIFTLDETVTKVVERQHPGREMTKVKIFAMIEFTLP